MAWAEVTLSDEAIFQWANGLWKGKKEPFSECIVIRNTNFSNNGMLSYHDVAILPVEKRQLKNRQLLPGDIILERSGGSDNQPVGRVAYFDKSEGVYSFSNFTSRLRINDRTRANPKFVHFFLHHLYLRGDTEMLQRRTTGIRNLDFQSYKNIKISLPPITEQRTIVTVLRTAQEAIEVRRKELTLERERKAALMEHFFSHGTRREPTKQTEIGEIPKNWELKRLEEICDVCSGGTPSRAEPRYWNGTIPWVKTGEINYRDICDTEEKITELGLENSATRIIPKGALLMAMYGQGITRGRVAKLCIDAAINQACAAIIPHEGVSVDYILYWLERSYKKVRDMGHGANQKNLNAGHVRSIIIGLPKFDEQQLIASAIASVSKGISTIERELVLHTELFNALLEKLMSGEISTQPLLAEKAA